MLEPWIVEEIRRREREDEAGRQLPIHAPEPPIDAPKPSEPQEEESERGVFIIDLCAYWS